MTFWWFLTTGALRGARCYGIRRVEQIPILFSHRKKKAKAEACLFYFDSYTYLFIDLWLAHEGDHRIYLLGNISEDGDNTLPMSWILSTRKRSSQFV